MSIAETTLFLREAFGNPKRIGSIMPSSKGLARAMAAWLPADPDSLVLELGPGTGQVTRALLDEGLRPDRLVAIEWSSSLAHLVKRRFPGIHVINDDAFELERIARQHFPADRPIGAVISSLPLRNFGAIRGRHLCDAIASVVAPGGIVVQYSYHIHRPRIACMESLNQFDSRIIWRNLPPARLYAYATASQVSNPPRPIPAANGGG